jgi:hypothetical protein
VDLAEESKSIAVLRSDVNKKNSDNIVQTLTALWNDDLDDLADLVIERKEESKYLLPPPTPHFLQSSSVKDNISRKYSNIKTNIDNKQTEYASKTSTNKLGTNDADQAIDTCNDDPTNVCISSPIDTNLSPINASFAQKNINSMSVDSQENKFSEESQKGLNEGIKTLSDVCDIAKIDEVTKKGLKSQTCKPGIVNNSKSVKSKDLIEKPQKSGKVQKLSQDSFWDIPEHQSEWNESPANKIKSYSRSNSKRVLPTRGKKNLKDAAVVINKAQVNNSTKQAKEQLDDNMINKVKRNTCLSLAKKNKESKGPGVATDLNANQNSELSNKETTEQKAKETYQKLNISYEKKCPGVEKSNKKTRQNKSRENLPVDEIGDIDFYFTETNNKSTKEPKKTARKENKKDIPVKSGRQSLVAPKEIKSANKQTKGKPEISKPDRNIKINKKQYLGSDNEFSGSEAPNRKNRKAKKITGNEGIEYQNNSTTNNKKTASLKNIKKQEYEPELSDLVKLKRGTRKNLAENQEKVTVDFEHVSQGNAKERARNQNNEKENIYNMKSRTKDGEKVARKMNQDIEKEKGPLFDREDSIYPATPESAATRSPTTIPESSSVASSPSLIEGTQMELTQTRKQTKLQSAVNTCEELNSKMHIPHNARKLSQRCIAEQLLNISPQSSTDSEQEIHVNKQLERNEMNSADLNSMRKTNTYVQMTSDSNSERKIPIHKQMSKSNKKSVYTKRKTNTYVQTTSDSSEENYSQKKQLCVKRHSQHELPQLPSIKKKKIVQENISKLEIKLSQGNSIKMYCFSICLICYSIQMILKNMNLH